MNTDLKNKFYQFNDRRANKRFFSKSFLSKWFETSLDRAIDSNDFVLSIDQQTQDIINNLVSYRKRNNINSIAIGISGGIDSAVTAALFKEAGWNVIGVLMPIRQNPLETHRGLELVSALGINYHVHDLTKIYDDLHDNFRSSIDRNLSMQDKDSKVRAGNIRARLRMITLYNVAAQHKGCVGSTDNFSELAAGFWTLHGDVGDLAPIQSLTKSWEVPLMAECLNVPASIVEAVPTDGLGIDAGDEAQFGFSYAQLDLVLLDLMSNRLQEFIDQASADDLKIIEAVKAKVASTAFKRTNPVNFPHPICDNWRYQQLAHLDNILVSDKQTLTPEVNNV